MSQGPGADKICPSLRVAANGGEGDASGGFDLNGRPESPCDRGPCPHRARRLVVDQEPRRAGGDRLLKLAERLDLDVQPPRTEENCLREGIRQRAPRGRECLPVIVLDHHGGGKVESMRRPTTREHCGDLEAPKSGRGLPRVQHATRRPRHRIDVAACHGGDPAGALQQIEQRPFGPQDSAERAGQCPHDTGRGDVLPFRHAPGDRLHPARGHHGVGVGQPRHHHRLARLDLPDAALTNRDAHLRAQIARAILSQRQRCDTIGVCAERGEIDAVRHRAPPSGRSPTSPASGSPLARR